MKIIYIGTGAYAIGDNSETAVEIVINNNAYYVSKLGEDVEIFDIIDKNILRNNSIKYNFVSLPKFLNKVENKISGIKRFIRKVLFSLKTASLLFNRRKEKIDIIHIQNQYPGFILMLLLKPFMKKTKFVYTAHTSFWMLPNSEFKKYYFKTLMDRFSFKFSDCIIFVGKSQMEGALSKVKLNENKIAVIQNGVNLDKFKPNKNINNDFLTALTVAKIEERKNQLLIIKAVNEIIKENKKFVFNLVGQFESNDYLDKIKNYISINKLENNIKLLGPVKNSELSHFYSNSDIFISASTAEGLPLTVLEAMASGNALIISDIGAHKEIKSDSSIVYFKSNDLTDLIDKLKIIIKNKSKLKNLKQKSRESAIKHYSWEKVSKEYIVLYKKFLLA